MMLLQRHGRLGQRRAVEAGLAMHRLGSPERPQDRARTAGEDRYLRPSRQLADAARIALGEGERNVAGTAGDTQHLRSEERRVGQEGVRPCRYQWWHFN